jgi:predicted MPP superfamily phosphohydrolase
VTQFLLSVVLGLIGLGLAVFAWASLIERHWYAIRRETVAVLPPGSLTGGRESVRILHISDIHLAPWQKRKITWMLRLGKLNPDLVVNTGDNLGHSAAIGPVLEALAPLREVQGVFVNGSNDYFAPKPRNPLAYLSRPSDQTSGVALNTAELVAGFESSGWLNLNNNGGQLTVAGLKLGFIGIDDAHDGLDDLGSLALSRQRAAECDLLIGVSHAPYLKVIDAMGAQKVDLMFAGHTHGGQVCLPFFGAIITNCDLPRKYAKGISAWAINGHNFLLNVCAGLGHSIYAPFRLACRPEVRLLELVERT